MKKIIFIVEKDENGFSAYAEDFDKHSIVTMGDNLSQLKENILDALNLQLTHNNEAPGLYELDYRFSSK